MASLICQNVFARLLRAWFVALFTVIATPTRAAGLEWWSPAPTDSVWTNRSLAEIQSAAESGDPIGQYYMSRACFLGLGRPNNSKEAFQWMLRAAEQGTADAQCASARFYYDSVGTHYDPRQGFLWIKRAVDQGHVEAMSIFGWAYAFGEGVPIDGHKAREWLERAVQGGARSGPEHFARYYLAGEGGLARRTNYVEALHWFERAASNGVVSAALSAADLCELGKGTPPDFDRALRWVRLAADKGNLDALERLASYYTSGKGEPRSPDEIPIKLHRRVADNLARNVFDSPHDESNPPNAPTLSDNCAILWDRYRFGFGTPRDLIAAAEWQWVAHQWRTRRAPDSRTSGPLYRAATNTVRAYSTEDNLWREAAILVDKALDQNLPEAWHRIGISYRDGSELTPKQPFVAWAWLNRAAEMQHAPSRDALKALIDRFTPEELALAMQQWVPPPKR
jgi:TPR repeat protein